MSNMASISSPSKQGKGKKRNSQAQLIGRLKIVVRRLPPNLPEDIFWQSVHPWVTQETATWKAFYPGKLRKKLNKENIPSRAYIAFKAEDQLALFSNQYDGHVFRDKNGVESHAVVEFAPYPKIPSEKKKVDVRNGTIEKDEDYISFIESLKASENAEPVTIEALIASAQPPPPPKTTPLLEALKAEKSAAKDKEAILRNHAHYNTAPRKEEKKKAASLAAPLSASKAAPDTKLKKSKKSQIEERIQAQEAQPVNLKVKSRDSLPSAVPANGSLQNPRPPKITKTQPQSRKAVTTSTSSNDTRASASTNNRSVTPSQAESTTRRTRPLFASRQFEAALNIAGLASSASDRRKREKEQDEQVPSSDHLSTQISEDLGAEKDKPSHTPSPKKDRPRRGGRPVGSGRPGVQASEVGNTSSVKIPSILQRSDTDTAPVILPRQSSFNVDVEVSESQPKNKFPIPVRGRRGRGFGVRGGGRGGGGRGAANLPRESG